MIIRFGFVPVVDGAVVPPRIIEGVSARPNPIRCNGCPRGRHRKSLCRRSYETASRAIVQRVRGPIGKSAVCFHARPSEAVRAGRLA